ncbi:MAG: hypothetical protein HY072_03735 [Deltaproteobacteria bacterium]|nr:hypothetical protein [Deltaproteobacteria bacterium]
MQVTVYQPSEGPTYAIRLCYAASSLGFAKTKTLSPQVLVSRRVNFADPYLGVSFQYTLGSIEIPIELEDGTQVGTLKGTEHASAWNAFLGIQLKAPNLGLQLTLEGSYSTVGMHTLGTKFGFSF